MSDRKNVCFQNIIVGAVCLSALIFFVAGYFWSTNDDVVDSQALLDVKSASHHLSLVNYDALQSLEIGADDYESVGVWAEGVSGIRPLVKDALLDGFISRYEFDEIKLEYHVLRKKQARERVLRSVSLSDDF